MGWVLIVYIVILFLDLLVGCTLIVWKCTDSAAEVDCQVAVSGTIASIAVWLLVILVCPCFMSRCELCNLLDNIIKKCAHFLEKIDPRQQDSVYIQNDIYLPTTESLLENDQEESQPNEDAENLYERVSHSKDSKSLLGKVHVLQSKDPGHIYRMVSHEQDSEYILGDVSHSSDSWDLYGEVSLSNESTKLFEKVQPENFCTADTYGKGLSASWNVQQGTVSDSDDLAEHFEKQQQDFVTDNQETPLLHENEQD